jgi:hypothetical protein
MSGRRDKASTNAGRPLIPWDLLKIGLPARKSAGDAATDDVRGVQSLSNRIDKLGEFFAELRLY